MSTVPSPTEVRAKLLPMTMAELEALAKRCGVPFTTLIKVRNGQTENPRLETVHAIWPVLSELPDRDPHNLKPTPSACTEQGV